MTFSRSKPTLFVELDAKASKVFVKVASGSAEGQDIQIAELLIEGYPDDQTRLNVLGKIILDSLRALAGQSNADADAANDEYMRTDVEPRAIGGDVQAQKIMATHCITKAIREKKPSLLDDAEHWYRRAIAQGDKEAEHFFTVVWPNQKPNVLEMIGDKAEPES